MDGRANPGDTFSAPFSRSLQESTFQLDGFVVEKLRGCGVAAVAAGQTVVMVNKGTDGVDFEQLFLGQEIHCLVDRTSKRVIYAHQHAVTLDMTDAPQPIADRV